MNSPNYKEWIKSLKEGDVVLLMDSGVIYSGPILFLNWNGDSSSNGYRAQYLYIPNFTTDSWHFRDAKSEEEKNEIIEKNWEGIFDRIKKNQLKSSYFSVCSVNSNAERRLFPFPIKFLTKNQLKYVNLIKHIKGYEY